MSFELITSVRVCLLYDPKEWNLIVFKMNIISMRKHIVDIGDMLNVCDKALLHVRSYDFYDTMLSTKQQQRDK